MQSTLRRAIAAAVVLPVLALTAACGSDDSGSDSASEKAAEKMIEAGSDGDVDVDIDEDGEEVSIETDEGTTTYGSKDVPEALPDDFPLAEGEIVTTMDSPNGAMVSLKTEGDVKAAFDQAIADLEEQGWTRGMVAEDGGVYSAVMTGETDEQSVILSGDDESGELTYLVSLTE